MRYCRQAKIIKHKIVVFREETQDNENRTNIFKDIIQGNNAHVRKRIYIQH